MLARSCLRHRGRLSSAVCSSIESSLRPALLPSTASPASLRPLQQRNAFSTALPPLGAEEATILTKGISELYSLEGVEVAWTRYHSMIVNKLSDLVAGTTLANDTPKNMLLKTARNPQMAQLFNYASMAHNNHFYWQQLSTQKKAMPTSLEDDIKHSFTSVDTFRKTFIETADGMFGPGFVWLVLQHRAPGFRGDSQQPELRILPTYLAGTPYPGAHERQQSTDMNTQNHESKMSFVSTETGLGSRQTPRSAYGGADVTPVLCVNTWEHAYMTDWGADGRRLFLEAWFDRVNWDSVAGKVNGAKHGGGRGQVQFAEG